jgi:hypothetical protein
MSVFARVMCGVVVIVAAITAWGHWQHTKALGVPFMTDGADGHSVGIALAVGVIGIVVAYAAHMLFGRGGKP